MQHYRKDRTGGPWSGLPCGKHKGGVAQVTESLPGTYTKHWGGGGRSIEASKSSLLDTGSSRTEFPSGVCVCVSHIGA